MSEWNKPLPQPLPETEFYWEAAKNHKLMALRCQDCRHWIHFPKSICNKCLSSNLQPEEMPSRGTVYSYTITHYVYHPGFQDEAPYAVVLVEMDGEPELRVFSNLRGVANEDIQIGMPVEVFFEDITDEVTLPQFRAVAA